MTNARWDRIKDVFNAALAVPQADRSALVARLCAGDEAIRHEVESLLEARTLSIVRTGGAADALAGMTTTSIPDPHAADRVGTMIARYKLLQIIGEGGFGTVYMAEQTEPVRRKVALKVIKPGMDSRAIIARFEAERQALAMMDHPHIARVLDGGVTPLTESGGGLPYFVMEYVVGDAVTRFADAHALSIAERLAVFQQVCSAVQHAHTKGIIHRDLKPANVLVSMVDGKPFAKVIDFGIAKATGAAGGRLTDLSFFTEHRQLIGTPEYMSPEQAEGSLDIDTRTDVYALGVLLYELLTGTTAIEGARLRSAAFDEMRRMIREDEPLAPSMKLSRSLETLARTAAARKVEPARLSALVKGELDWIVLKALEKERARRYETPSALADDVRRHLAGEAVVAAPVSRAYRVRKFVRRNKGAVGAVGAVMSTLLLGGAATTWFWLDAVRERSISESVSVFLSKGLDPLVEGVWSGGYSLRAEEIAGRIAGDRARDQLSAREQNAVLMSAAALAQLDQIKETQHKLKYARDEAEWNAYTANLALAQASMAAFDFPEARRTLNLAPPSRHGWEYRFLDLQARAVIVSLAGVGERGDVWLDDAGDLALRPLRGGPTVQAWNTRSSTDWRIRSITAMDEQAQRRTVATAISVFDPVFRDLSRAEFDGAAQRGSEWLVANSAWYKNIRSFLVDTRGRHALRWRSALDAWTYAGPDRLIGMVLPWGQNSGNVALLDLNQLGGPEYHDPIRPDLLVSAILASSPNGPSGLTITTPDGSRRIFGGADKTLRFYEAQEGKTTLPATAEQPEGVYREVAVFRMPEAVTNLQMTGDGTRLIIHLEGGSARVWDIREPEERRRDLQAEWAERVPAGAYLDTLWASDTPDGKLYDAVINDASLSPLRRLVAAEMLEERLEDDRLAAEQAFGQLKLAAEPATGASGPAPTADPASITAALRAAAAAVELPKRVKARLIASAAGWEYKKPEATAEQKLAQENQQRRLTEATLTVERFQSWDTPNYPGDLGDLERAVATRDELLGVRHAESAKARWMLGIYTFARGKDLDSERRGVALMRVALNHHREANGLSNTGFGMQIALAQAEAWVGQMAEASVSLRQALDDLDTDEKTASSKISFVYWGPESDGNGFDPSFHGKSLLSLTASRNYQVSVPAARQTLRV